MIAVIRRNLIFQDYANFQLEALNMLNGFVRIFEINAPNWSHILPHVMHGTDLQYMYRAQVGENIGLFSHSYIYFGATGTLVIAFSILALLGFFYYRSNSIFIRAQFLFFLILYLSNGGSGLFDYIVLIEQYFFIWMLYALCRGFPVASSSRQPQFKPSQIYP